MSSNYSCNCLNVIFCITEPKKFTDEDLKTFETILSKVKFTEPFFGSIPQDKIHFEHKILIKEIGIDEYNLICCKNCDQNVFLVKKSDNKTIIFDSKLRKLENDFKKENEKGISKFFRIKLPGPNPTNTQTAEYPYTITSEKNMNREYQKHFEELEDQIHKIIEEKKTEQQKKMREFKQQQKIEFRKFRETLITERNILWNQATKDFEKSNGQTKSKNENRKSKINIKKESMQTTTSAIEISPHARRLKPTRSKSNIEKAPDEFSAVFAFDEQIQENTGNNHKDAKEQMDLYDAIESIDDNTVGDDNLVEVTSKKGIKISQTNDEKSVKIPNLGVSVPINIAINHDIPRNKMRSSPANEFVEPHLYAKSHQTESETIQSQSFNVPSKRVPIWRNIK
ncbi:akt1 substrate 1 protein [Anaeramoeba ignava]|uniref:Akt1 substrate 1 protein n=1 Tax=Anaeramoeba ignava TaxID=1746090 RepID=A0A9Q0REB8_ANAIG|nr:akt1 substrate 1 protein [Anaeramoeba ignava]|eukprot:Anaeramoba_ignava/a351202_113.p1 GENE.a351202_113~~a351202_113.p1  ORF type:complete len:396 (-),score=108.86 a351202_113:286-1473(-)